MDTPFINSRAEALYKEYLEKGKTPADFNGMSLMEYANQRAYSESFKKLDTTELVRKNNEKKEELNYEKIFEGVAIGEREI